ncbi:MAG: hypothetical protein R3B48_14080 [Kofleriaceae bacterium]
MKRALVVVVWSCVFLSAPRADDESDRKRYLDEIDSLLDGLAGDLDRVAADSGTSYLDYAARKTDEIKDKAGRLGSVRGGDDRAKRYSDYYPGYADKLKESIGYLRQMKEKQRELDALPRLCETGKNEHKRIQASSACDAEEVTIPGAGMRIDCVKVSSGTCTLIEIKPKNTTAMAKGTARVTEYRDGVSTFYNDNKGNVEQAFKGKMQIFKQCISDGRIRLAIEVMGYEFCPSEGALYREFVSVE